MVQVKKKEKECKKEILTNIPKLLDADEFIELFNPIDSDSDSGSEPEPERAIEDAPNPEPPGEQ